MRVFNKKLLTIISLIILMIPLSACAGKNSSPDTSAVVPPSTATPFTKPSSRAETQQPVQTEEQAVQTENTPEQTEKPPQETIEQNEEPIETAQESEIPEVSDAPAAPTAAQIIGNNADSPALLPESEDMGQGYIDRIIFLGDSTTYGLRYYEMLSGGEDTHQVWTPESGTLTLSYQSFATIVYPRDGSEITIREATEREKPDIMVITLGVNGVSFMDKDYFKSEYTDLVNTIAEVSPDTTIILQSIFPIAENYEYQGDINNHVISQANTWVLEVASEAGVHYLDTFSVLIGDDGFLPQDWQNGDGLHFNETSFAVVLQYIRTHAVS